MFYGVKIKKTLDSAGGNLAISISEVCLFCFVLFVFLMGFPSWRDRHVMRGGAVIYTEVLEAASYWDMRIFTQVL